MNDARLRTILLVIAVYHLLLGAFMFFAPGAFYDSLGKFPPKNTHYVKDVSTFYIALGVCGVWGLSGAVYFARSSKAKGRSIMVERPAPQTMVAS